jgi:hypothetical protein
LLPFFATYAQTFERYGPISLLANQAQRVYQTAEARWVKSAWRENYRVNPRLLFRRVDA